MNVISKLVPAAVQERTIPHMLLRQAEQSPQKPLLAIGDVRWTMAEAADAASRTGSALREAGIERSDRVASIFGNCVQALEVFLGCGWIGAVAVPINIASKAPQIQYILQDSGAKVLALEHKFLHELADVDFSRTSIVAIWVIPDSEQPLSNASTQGVATHIYPTSALPIEAEDVLPSETLAILYTSGTTGAPKGVICPHGQYYLFGLYSAQMLGVTASDVLSTTLPLFHINALNTFAQASITGCQIVIHERFSVSGFWDSCESCGATVVYLLGAMVPMLLAQPAQPAERRHRVRIGLGGGAPGSAAEEFLKRTSVPLLDGYASTETNLVISTPTFGSGRGAMGVLREGFHARIVDEFDVPVATGVAGELVLRADEPFAFSNGYFGMPDKTVEAWRNLWFHTGDRVVQEEDGNFRFVDRLKDAIRRRGENISSYEVEQALLSHPHVAQVAVIPVRSDLAEDEVMAVVVAHPVGVVDLPDLVSHCERRLPYFAVPRYFDIATELPRTQNGKVQKFKLKEIGITATTWERPNASRRPQAKVSA